MGLAADDLRFMARALTLARQGWFTTQPNPRVGCVIVKEGKIIGEGWHAKAGEAHAEVAALAQVVSAKGATAYVTLEPCSHFGKTPPCSDALIAAGVSRVVAAMEDPNPLVSGRGLEQLRQAGIEVTIGILAAEAEQINRGFIKRMRSGLPWVRTKIAMSLDGRTALASGESQWITSAAARQDVQRLRAESGAILTGIGTVLTDDPQMNARVEFAHVAPVRVIVYSRLRLPEHAKICKSPGPVWVMTASQDHTKIARLQALGVEIIQVPDRNGQVDLRAVLACLAQRQVNEVLVEAGALLNGALLQQGLLDDAVIYIAPKLLGDTGRGIFHVPPFANMASVPCLVWQELRQVGSDLRLTVKFKAE